MMPADAFDSCRMLYLRVKLASIGCAMFTWDFRLAVLEATIFLAAVTKVQNARSSC